jgi:hypothetical protein
MLAHTRYYPLQFVRAMLAGCLLSFFRFLRGFFYFEVSDFKFDAFQPKGIGVLESFIIVTFARRVTVDIPNNILTFVAAQTTFYHLAQAPFA